MRIWRNSSCTCRCPRLFDDNTNGQGFIYCCEVSDLRSYIEYLPDLSDNGIWPEFMDDGLAYWLQSHCTKFSKKVAELLFYQRYWVFVKSNFIFLWLDVQINWRNKASVHLFHVVSLISRHLCTQIHVHSLFFSHDLDFTHVLCLRGGRRFWMGSPHFRLPSPWPWRRSSAWCCTLRRKGSAGQAGTLRRQNRDPTLGESRQWHLRHGLPCGELAHVGQGPDNLMIRLWDEVYFQHSCPYLIFLFLDLTLSPFLGLPLPPLSSPSTWRPGHGCCNTKPSQEPQQRLGPKGKETRKDIRCRRQWWPWPQEIWRS